MRQNSIRISVEHEARYRELFSKDVYLSQAQEIVFKEFHLPRRHTRQAVTQWANQVGITIPRQKHRCIVKQVVKLSGNGDNIDLDTQIDLTLRAFEALKEMPFIKADLERQRRANRLLEERINNLESADKKRSEQAMRFKLAKQQGELHNNFTEHIFCEPHLIISKSEPLFNISKGSFVFN